MKSYIIILVISLIALSGCTPQRELFTYDVADSPEVSSFFVDGLSIAAVETDSCYVSLSVPSNAHIGGYGHLKVWFLYQNLGSSQYLLRPWSNLILHLINNKNGKEYEIHAETPNGLLKKIDKQEGQTSFLSLLGGVLQSANTLSSNSPSNYKASEVSYIAQSTVSDISSINHWYSVMRGSVSSAVFKKNTIFPNESSNGYVYFPLQTEERSFTNKMFKSEDYSIVIDVITPTRTVKVHFNPEVLE
jgi:hypothetical protein